MIVQNELLPQISGVLEKFGPPLSCELISTESQINEFKQAGMWSWDHYFMKDGKPDYSSITQGLDRDPIGFLFFGLRLNGEPALITIFKRFSSEAQEKEPILIANGDIRDPSTLLTLQTLADVTQEIPAIELGDAYLRGYPRNLGIYTPFRHGTKILNHYIELVGVIHENYPHDYLLTFPMGVLPWTKDLEKNIVSDIAGNGGKLSVQEYIDRYNHGEHYMSDMHNNMGKVRSLSKLTERLITRSNLSFRTVAYSPCDFGLVSLIDPIEQ